MSNSSALSSIFLILSYFSNHSFDLFASNHVLISALIVSSSSCFQVTSSAICLLYNQNRIISYYQSLLSDIWHAELFQIIKFCLVIIIMIIYELCIIISKTLITFMCNNNFEHSWECMTIFFEFMLKLSCYSDLLLWFWRR